MGKYAQNKTKTSNQFKFNALNQHKSKLKTLLFSGLSNITIVWFCSLMMEISLFSKQRSTIRLDVLLSERYYFLFLLFDMNALFASARLHTYPFCI